MAKKTRVDALVQASATAMAELKMANMTRIQPMPQTRSATTRIGFWAEVASPAMSCVRQPTTIAQEVSRKKIHMMRMDSMMARGRFFLGLRDSSASGATDSKPVKVRMEKTMAGYRPVPGGSARVNGAKLVPPGPGLTR